MVPAIDLGSIDLEIAAEGNESDELKSGDESGRIPVSTTAPTDTARHTRHIGAINGTYETDPIPGTSGVTEQWTYPHALFERPTMTVELEKWN